eukprot:NODE_143_length_17796_cov_0.252020.p8 type:complete len:237 gc:universal NODE_143_length_17796_cov_0.252020:9204-8494(-)
MQFANQKVLVTGGASGIGEGIVQYILSKGAEVVICGRRQDVLDVAKSKYPSIKTLKCDVSSKKERIKLIQDTNVNILVNNAGIQKEIDLFNDQVELIEIDINLTAVIDLCCIFAKHSMSNGTKNAAIINVTSGLSFVPKSNVPVYCASKAALHSFTLSLRHQLMNKIKVIELIPPAVDTDLGGPGKHTFGVKVSDFIQSTMPRIENGELEVGYQMSEMARLASRQELDNLFVRLHE